MIDTVAASDLADSDLPTRALPLRTLLGLTHLAFAHQFMWTALLVIVVPAQVVTIVGGHTQASALSLVLVVGAAVACLAQVIGGALSDRATFRLGRRRPFMIGGKVVALVGLYLMSQAHSLPALAAAFLLVQGGYNAGQVAYEAVLPDLVPEIQRGRASGLLSLLALCGAIGGSVAAGAIVKEGSYPSFLRIYLLIIAVNVVLTTTTVLALRERRLLHAPPVDLATFVRGLGFDPRAYPNFTWVLVTRFLVMMGYYTVQNFLLYYVRDIVGSKAAESDSSHIVAAVTVSAAATALIAGLLSDRFGRKPLVYASALFVAVVSLTFIAVHSVAVAIVVGALWGAGWGVYLSVDWALACDVLPQPTQGDRAGQFAHFMGIWSLALILPQVLSPTIGPLIDGLNAGGRHSGYTAMFAFVFVYFLLGAVLVRRIRGVR